MNIEIVYMLSNSEIYLNYKLFVALNVARQSSVNV